MRSSELLVERFFETLITGNRVASRALVEEAREHGLTPVLMIRDLFWPTYQLIEKLHRADQLTTLGHHLATRLLRVLVDHNAGELMAGRRAGTGVGAGRTIFAFCGENDEDELGGQMAVDLLEAAGFSVTFAGGGVPNDEALARVNEEQPSVLLMFSSASKDLPSIRQLIDTLGQIRSCPNMQIVVGGGVFNRAEGLAEEIGADLWASSPLEVVERLVGEPTRKAEPAQRTVGRGRRPNQRSQAA